MKDTIIQLLSEALPTVDFDSDFLFGELDSLGVATIMIILSSHYDIPFEAADVTPRNFMNVDALVKLVETKLAGR